MDFLGNAIIETFITILLGGGGIGVVWKRWIEPFLKRVGEAVQEVSKLKEEVKVLGLLLDEAKKDREQAESERQSEVKLRNELEKKFLKLEGDFKVLNEKNDNMQDKIIALQDENKNQRERLDKANVEIDLAKKEAMVWKEQAVIAQAQVERTNTLLSAIENISIHLHVDNKPDKPDPTPSGPGGGGKPDDKTVDFVEAIGKPLPEQQKKAS